MSLIAITLTEQEQELLLKMADEVAAERGICTPWESIARKIYHLRNIPDWERELLENQDRSEE